MKNKSISSGQALRGGSYALAITAVVLAIVVVVLLVIITM